MNCNGYLDIEFASYLVINNWMNVTDIDVNDIQLSIAVNTDNLNFYKAVENYTLPEPVTIPNPCDPTDPTKAIIVNDVDLNVVRVDGHIGYYVGAEILTQSENVEIDNNEPYNQLNKMNFATVGGIVYVYDEDVLIQDNPSDPIPEFKVKVMNTELSSVGSNDAGEHVYLIEGIFRIDLNQL
ncbi:hypothetical protein [Romboutsia sp. Marseille-P6047]|uniref:hypothetical protein n=1 Tax=Romboutsia sp. Marseille-P6047 TaxID=2161817 RepID=UPI000F057540|nr:hypothetical protein [Romboutsia sp. Marseille-P6047]